MKALQGRRIWLTRSESGNKAWQPAVRAAGAVPACYSCLNFELLSKRRLQAVEVVAAADWVVFSSPRGVQAFHDLRLRVTARQRIACIGPATAEHCKRSIRVPDLEAAIETAAGLGQALLEQDSWQSAALVGALDARPELRELLHDGGQRAVPCPVYMTTGPSGETPAPEISASDAVFLASPSAFEGLRKTCQIPAATTLISIGPTTSETIRKVGFKVAAESNTRDIQGLLNALESVYQSSP